MKKMVELYKSKKLLKIAIEYSLDLSSMEIIEGYIEKYINNEELTELEKSTLYMFWERLCKLSHSDFSGYGTEIDFVDFATGFSTTNGSDKYV